MLDVLGETAYITNNFVQTLLSCTVTPPGTIASSCTSITSSNFTNIIGVALSKNELFAYVSNLGGNVTVCPITDSPITCFDSGAVFNGPEGIALT